MAPWNEDMCLNFLHDHLLGPRRTLSGPYAHPFILTPPPLFTAPKPKGVPSLRLPGPPTEAPEGAAHYAPRESRVVAHSPQGPQGPSQSSDRRDLYLQETQLALRPIKTLYNITSLRKQSRLSGAVHTCSWAFLACSSRPGVQLSTCGSLIKREVTANLPSRHFKPSNPPSPHDGRLCDQGYDFNIFSFFFSRRISDKVLGNCIYL